MLGPANVFVNGPLDPLGNLSGKDPVALGDVPVETTIGRRPIDRWRTPQPRLPYTPERARAPGETNGRSLPDHPLLRGDRRPPQAPGKHRNRRMAGTILLRAP